MRLKFFGLAAVLLGLFFSSLNCAGLGGEIRAIPQGEIKIVYNPYVIDPNKKYTHLPPMEISKKQTMVDVLNQIDKENLNLEIFVVRVKGAKNRHIVCTNEKGKWQLFKVTKTIAYLGLWKVDEKAGIETFIPKYVAGCGNPVDGVSFKRRQRRIIETLPAGPVGGRGVGGYYRNIPKENNGSKNSCLPGGPAPRR